MYGRSGNSRCYYRWPGFYQARCGSEQRQNRTCRSFCRRVRPGIPTSARGDSSRGKARGSRFLMANTSLVSHGKPRPPGRAKCVLLQTRLTGCSPSLRRAVVSWDAASTIRTGARSYGTTGRGGRREQRDAAGRGCPGPVGVECAARGRRQPEDVQRGPGSPLIHVGQDHADDRRGRVQRDRLHVHVHRVVVLSVAGSVPARHGDRRARRRAGVPIRRIRGEARPPDHPPGFLRGTRQEDLHPGDRAQRFNHDHHQDDAAGERAAT